MQVNKLLKEIERWEHEYDRAQWNLEQVTKELKDNYGIEDVKGAGKVAKELRTELEKIDKEIQKLTKKLNDLMGDYGNDEFNEFD